MQKACLWVDPGKQLPSAAGAAGPGPPPQIWKWGLNSVFYSASSGYGYLIMQEMLLVAAGRSCPTKVARARGQELLFGIACVPLQLWPSLFAARFRDPLVG